MFFAPLGLQEASTLVSSISTVNTDLSNATSMLTTSLANVFDSLTSLQTTCAGTAAATLCASTLDPIITSVQTAQNSVPTVS